MEISQRLAQESGLSAERVRQTLALFDEGATVPFIARYRKEKTGALDETQIRDLAHRYEFHKELEARKETVLATIREQGKLTPELEAKIKETADRDRARRPLSALQAQADDPGAQGPRSRPGAPGPLARRPGRSGSRSGRRGGPLSQSREGRRDGRSGPPGRLRHPGRGMGRRSPMLRKWLRALIAGEGFLLSAARKESAERKTKFEMYYNFREKIDSLPSHRILALLRGREGKSPQAGARIPQGQGRPPFRLPGHPPSPQRGRPQAPGDGRRRHRPAAGPLRGNRDPPRAADAGRSRGVRRLRREPPRPAHGRAGRPPGRHRHRSRLPHRLQGRGRGRAPAGSSNPAPSTPTSPRTTPTGPAWPSTR